MRRPPHAPPGNDCSRNNWPEMPDGDEKTELIRRLQRIESTDERDLCY